MEKSTPHCKLSVVKTLVRAGKVRTTVSAVIDAKLLGFDLAGMIELVLALRRRASITCTLETMSL